jgi:hypothetical protein
MISVEGVILPNVLLFNLQIIDAVKTLNILNFRGGYCKNDLSKTSVRQ